MDTHVRALGAFNIVFGVSSAVVAVAMFALYGGPIDLYNSLADNILALLVSVSITFHMLLAIPCVVGGFYLRSYAEWSRGVLIVTSALNVLNPPIGSVLGCYGLWVLLTPETDPLFSHPPPVRPGARPPAPRPKPAARAAASTASADTTPEMSHGKPPTPGILPSGRS